MWDLGRWLGATFPLPVKLLSREGEMVDERVAKRRGAENERMWWERDAEEDLPLDQD